jgi:small-conductance mechanosensitive channel
MKWQQVLTRVREILALELFPINNVQVTVGTLAIVLLILLVSWWISRLLQLAVIKALRRASNYDEGTIQAFRRLVRYVVTVIGISIAVHTVGINLSALFAAGAFFAVAIGFAMQNITENWVSGVILLGERTIKPGDVIEFDGRLVQVREMNMRVTVVRTLDDEDMIIPNSALAQAAVKNFTFRDPDTRVRAQVGVAYSSDLHRVREVLEAAADRMPWRTEREPVVQLAGFGSSSVDYDVSVWTDNPWGLANLRSELREAIWFALQDAQITIAFPQLDVHFDPAVAAGFAADQPAEQHDSTPAADDPAAPNHPTAARPA